jgi:hypothetical protein
MGTVAKIAADQAVAFLIGLVLVVVIQPTTPGGTLLLILVTLATVNVIMQSIRLLLRFSKRDAR